MCVGWVRDDQEMSSSCLYLMASSSPEEVFTMPPAETAPKSWQSASPSLLPGGELDWLLDDDEAFQVWLFSCMQNIQECVGYVDFKFFFKIKNKK